MSCARGCCVDQPSHYRSLRLDGAQRPQREQQRNFDADMHAYKRLRTSGVQPRTIRGSAELERSADSMVEIEQGRVIPNARLRKEVEQATKDVSAAASAVPS